MAVSNRSPLSIGPSGEQEVDACAAIALRAIVWTISDDDRAGRLLALTGLASDDLRVRIGDPALLAAAIGFLEAHEADLIACAGDIGETPAALVNARAVLER